MNNKKAKSQNLLIGAMVLLISNLLVKVIGAVYKIPLTNMLGDEGMKCFNSAYSVYVTIYLISTAGIPVAISRMVSTAQEKGNQRESKKILKVALVLFSIVGFVAMMVMMLAAKGFAKAVSMYDSYKSMYAIAPTLLFICISSTFRGYYQGKRNMNLSAIAQVVEAVSKLFIGLIAAKLVIDIFDISLTAAYAISGVTIGTLLSLIVSLFYYIKESRNEVILEGSQESVRSTKSILCELAMICIPIAISSCLTGLTRIIDTSLIVNGLNDVGVDIETGGRLYGVYSSIVVSLLDMPPSLITPLAISLLPNLVAYYTSKQKQKAYLTIDSSFRIGSLIAFPCVFGMAFVSEGVIRTLFVDKIVEGTNYTNIQISSPALSVVSISIFFLAMIAITNSILQAWHREIFPIISALCGIGVKCVTEYVLLRIPGMGINGAALSTVACHFTIILMNLIFVIKFTGYVPKVTKIFAKPLFAGLFCGVGAYFTYMGLDMLTTGHLFGRTQALICLVPAVGVAAVIYVAALAVMKGFVREDIEMLPKGKKICAFLTKFKAM